MKMNEHYVIAKQQIEQFQSKGFIRLKNVVSKQLLSEFRALMLESINNIVAEGDKQKRIDDYSSIFTQVTNLWKLDPRVQFFVLSQHFGDIARRLMGVEHVRIYHDQALVKQSGAEKTPWHQDYFYWPIDSSNTLTMWIPMHDCPKQMGTMQFVVGSHRNDNIQKMPISKQSETYFQNQIKQNNLSVQTFDLELGDATFHYGRTLHCAHPNSMGKAREAMTIIWMQDGVRAVKEQNLNEFRKVDLAVFCPNVQLGKVINSQLNPLIC